MLLCLFGHHEIFRCKDTSVYTSHDYVLVTKKIVFFSCYCYIVGVELLVMKDLVS